MTTTNTNPLLLSSYTPGQIAFIGWLRDRRDTIAVFDECTVSRKELLALLQSDSAYVAVPAWIAAPKARRAGRGYYLIPEINTDPSTLPTNTNKRGRKAGSRNRKGRTATTPVQTWPTTAAPTGTAHTAPTA